MCNKENCCVKLRKEDLLNEAFDALENLDQK